MENTKSFNRTPQARACVRLNESPGRTDEESARLTPDQAFHLQHRERRKDSRRFQRTACDDVILMSGVVTDQIDDLSFLVVQRQFSQAVNFRGIVRGCLN